jgi:DNA-binding MarR family transcriptional regulator
MPERSPRRNKPKRNELVLERFLPYRLSVLSNRISQAIAREYGRRFELGVTEWRVVAVLARSRGLSPTEIAARTAMDKVAVSRAISALTAAGRVAREAHDGDGRRSLVALTPRGRAVYRQVAPLALAYERRLLDALSAGERRQLESILERLAQVQHDVAP